MYAPFDLVVRLDPIRVHGLSICLSEFPLELSEKAPGSLRATSKIFLGRSNTKWIVSSSQQEQQLLIKKTHFKLKNVSMNTLDGRNFENSVRVSKDIAIVLINELERRYVEVHYFVRLLANSLYFLNSVDFPKKHDFSYL